MNKLVFLAVVLAVVALTDARHKVKLYSKDHKDDSDEKSNESYEKDAKKLSSLLESKYNITIIRDIMHLAEQAQKQCPHLKEKMEEVSTKVETCIDEIEFGSETLCSLIKTNVPKCTKPISDLIASCLPEESKDLPYLADKVIIAVIGQVCHSTVEEILELFNPCIFNKDFDEFQSCKDIKNVFVEHKDKLPSKSLICSTIPKVRSCAKEHREASCTNQITRKAALKIYTAIEDSIQGECDAANKL